MSFNSLLIKGAVNTSGEKPEVLKMEVSHHDISQDGRGHVVCEIIFNHADQQLLKIGLINLSGVYYLQELSYQEERWSEAGVLMALSVALKLTGYSEFIITGDEVVTKADHLQASNTGFRELIFQETIVNSVRAYRIKHVPEEILITHNFDGFSPQSDGSLLDAALGQGVELKYMCRAGICMKCRKKIISGACIEIYPQAESSMIKEMHLLTCNSQALTSLVIG